MNLLLTISTLKHFPSPFAVFVKLLLNCVLTFVYFSSLIKIDIKIVKLFKANLLIAPGAYPGFCSTNWLGVHVASPPARDASPSKSI